VVVEWVEVYRKAINTVPLLSTCSREELQTCTVIEPTSNGIVEPHISQIKEGREISAICSLILYYKKKDGTVSA
jgi:hypothetical protein